LYFVAAVRLLLMTLVCKEIDRLCMEVVLRLGLACGLSVATRELQQHVAEL
jgi:hypothetical protein